MHYFWVAGIRFYMKFFKKRVSVLNLVLVCCCVVLFATMSVLFGYSLCNNGLIIASSKQNVGSYYLIEVDKFEDYDSAVNYASNLKKQGGAGYVRYDKGHRVFLSAYLTKDDANSVVSKLEGFNNACIYSLKIDDFDLDNGLEKGVNKVIRNNIISFKCAIENINNVLIEFDKGEKQEIDVKNCCLLILEELTLQIDKFMDVYYLSTTMVNYKNNINEFYNLINEITKLDCLNLEFSSICRYQEISCMFTFKKILELV